MDRTPRSREARRGRSRGPGDSERRRRPRSSYEGWVELMVEGRRQLAEGVDLAPGGIGLRMRSAPPLDGKAVAEFTLPGISLPLAVDGRIAWCDGAGRVGVLFDAPDPGLAELIENYIDGRL